MRKAREGFKFDSVAQSVSVINATGPSDRSEVSCPHVDSIQPSQGLFTCENDHARSRVAGQSRWEDDLLVRSLCHEANPPGTTETQEQDLSTSEPNSLSKK